MDLAPFASLLGGRRAVVLTGAGCSTESGIPAYRGEGAPAEPRTPIQHRGFLDRIETRRRYWARSVLGWPRLSAARPNAAHLALAELERRASVVGVITQNVDGLHTAAGSRAVVELHGAVARVRCLECGRGSSRDELPPRLLAANPGWLDRVARAPTAPDGDADVPDELVDDFSVVACETCGGTLMPDVVFHGGTVPRAILDGAWALFDTAHVLPRRRLLARALLGLPLRPPRLRARHGRWRSSIVAPPAATIAPLHASTRAPRSPSPRSRIRSEVHASPDAR